VLNLTVSYKYVKTMGVIKRPLQYFVNSIADKWEAFFNLKLELHVSPFYKLGDVYMYQPVFDFDGPDAKFGLDQFISMFPKVKSPPWYLEYSGVGIHLFSTYAYGPIKKVEIIEFRRQVRDRLNIASSFDITSSIRDLPIRRLPSVNSLRTEMMVPCTFAKCIHPEQKDRDTIKSWVLNYTVPSKLKHMTNFWKDLT